MIVYPRGYIRCLADIVLSSDAVLEAQMIDVIKDIVDGAIEQFPGILRDKPEIAKVQQTSAGKRFLRVKFRIWPGRGAPIESTFKQDVVQALKALDETYADYKVSVNYEVEKRSTRFARKSS